MAEILVRQYGTVRGMNFPMGDVGVSAYPPPDTSIHSPAGGAPFRLLASPPLHSRKTVALPPVTKIIMAGSDTAAAPMKIGRPEETALPGTGGNGPTEDPP